MIGPLTPGAAGPWMWARISCDVRPEKLMLYLIVWVKVFTVKSPRPTPAEGVGGTSFAPIMLGDSRWVIWAPACATSPSATTALGSKRERIDGTTNMLILLKNLV